MPISIVQAAVQWFSPFLGRRLPPISAANWRELHALLQEEIDGTFERLCYRLRAKGWFEAAAYLQDEEFAKSCRRATRARVSKGWRPLAFGSDDYPARLLQNLGRRAPALLWAKGPKIPQRLVGVIGSRELTKEETRFATETGKILGELGYSVASGYARGADKISGLSCRHSVHFLPGGAPRSLPSNHTFLTLFPEAPEFDRFTALGRNRLIYGSSEVTIVVSSRFGTGGAWTGAIEAKRNRTCPLIVFCGKNRSTGNSVLSNMEVTTVSSSEEISQAVLRLITPFERVLAV